MTNYIQEKIDQDIWGKLRSDKFLNYRNINAFYGGISAVEESKGPAILDVACGEGKMLGLFKQNFDRVVGIDASNYALSKAREKFPNIDLHESLIENLELSERFDTVCLLNVLEHVKDPIFVLKKSASFLKDNGILLIHVPNAEALNRKIAVKMGTLTHLEELSPFDLKTTGHRRYYKTDTLVNDIVKSGLNVVKTGGIMLKMLSMAQMDWLLENGLWEEGGFGWGRVGSEKQKNWKEEFCRASYEIGKMYPRECNVIFAVCKK